MKFLILSLIINFSWADRVEDPENVCAELEQDESFFVHQNASESPTGLPRFFEIFKDPEVPDVYHINVPLSLVVFEYEVSENRMGYISTHRLSPNDVLEHIAGSENLDLIESKAYSSAEAMAQFMAAQKTEAAMFVRAQECLVQSHGKIVSAEGEDLRFHARTLGYMGIDYSQENVIAIAPSPHRSSSAQWAEDIDCNVIVHEVLHLLGLVDGYEEALLDDYQCRHLEPNDSIMNSTAALGPTFDYIVCPIEKDVVPQMFNVGADTEVSCPSEGNKVSSGSYQDMRRARESSGLEIYYSERTTPPVLKKAQVRMILKPFCDSENEAYITCSENAYRSHVDGCIETPSYCADGSYLDQ